MSLYIGIDLGTTYSAVAHVVNGTARIIQTTQNSVTTPSAVYFDQNGNLEIGEEAKLEQKARESVATFYKRNIGQNTADYHLEDGNAYSAVDLSSIFLKELIRRVEEQLKKKVDGAVITVPAYFTDHEKSNTRKAAERAGIRVLHMINEPTAAAIAYGLNKQENRKIMVYDLGGGTFDVSVAEIQHDMLKIIATTGDFQLGGKNWDSEICRWAAEQYEAEFQDDFSGDVDQMDALMVDAEKLKQRLTKTDAAELHVSYEGNKGVYKLTESEFRRRTRHLLERTGTLIQKMFVDEGITWADIDDVILVGGSTRMRMVEDYIIELRGVPALHGINADEAVALGAALMADAIAQKMNSFTLTGNMNFELVVGDKKISDVISHSLGLIAAKEEQRGQDKYRVFYNEIMIRKNTTLENATVTKKFILNSDTQDIYLTQWELESLPEEQAIIGKYQVKGIEKKSPFTVTYYHNPDGTVDISAEQNGRKLLVEKMLNYADRTFDDELIIPPAKGAVTIAIDLSGSMSSLEDESGISELLARASSGIISSEEKKQIEWIEKWISANDENNWLDVYEATTYNRFTALGMTKKFVHDFIKMFPPKCVSFSIIGFSDRVKVYCPITYDIDTVLSAVNELKISNETGYCNGAQPMDAMFDMLKKKQQEETLAFSYAVVLTDGYWEDKPSQSAIDSKKKYISSGMEIIAQGFGSAKEEFIRKLATVTDLSGVGDISTLGESLSNIAQKYIDEFNLTD